MTFPPKSDRAPVYVGIDLGTTNSVAAVYDGSDVSVVRNGQGSLLTPSIVRFDGRGKAVSGGRARRFLDTDPANTQTEFKRLMGTSHVLSFPASGVSRSPEELSAELLRLLRADIADQIGFPPERAVISVPALFELHQIAATAEAARQAGFERVEMIQEPVASAIAAGWSKNAVEGPWLVYDLGGGTFDVSLLDTTEGMLQVVGHDGDNFLGGRDFDRKLVDLLIQGLAESGVAIDAADPAHALAVRRLRFLAEEAKIELTRAVQVTVSVSGIEIGGEELDAEIAVTRAEYEALVLPLIERTLEISLGLMERHGVRPGALQRVVLVGGPTVTPLLRARIREALEVEIGDGLDPMTLVARGAALFAGTVALDGRPVAPEEAAAGLAEVWWQFPTMTADLTPFVVGKLLDHRQSGIRSVRLERADDGWRSQPAACAEDGTFAAMVELFPRRQSVFTAIGLSDAWAEIPLRQTEIRIAHGLTLGDPPLGRSIGVALANDGVARYFHRGAALPIRRSFTLRTVETIDPRSEGYVLNVPIVQGDFSAAHLCRLVGTLEIPASRLERPLLLGAEIELMLELDRAGRLTAQARIVETDQLFSHVALLVTPRISFDELQAGLAALRRRAEDLSRAAFKSQSPQDAGRMMPVYDRLEEISRGLDAFHGGDLDAGEKARREITEADALICDLEAEGAWPRLASQLSIDYPRFLAIVARYGSVAERDAFDEAHRLCRQAIADRREGEAGLQFGLLRQIGWAAYFRSPTAWAEQFDLLAARVGDATDLPRASQLVERGKRARRENDMAELERVVRGMAALMPADSAARALAHRSGVTTL